LLLDVAAKAARTAAAGGRGPVLYVTGEESAAQVRGRAERIGALEPNLLIADETELGVVLGHVQQACPSLLIVDSVQTISSTQVEGGAGGVAQVRAVAASLIRVAKESDLPTLLVGHVTKDGGIAGPRVLEHLVDVVCQFEGDRHSRLRLLRAVKNRYGPTDEVGCFELTDSGIYGLADPSGLFLSRTTRGVPGTCAAVSLEGRRPLPTEIQSLVAPSSGGSPRRTTSGVDHARVAMILAVLQARIGADTSGADVYVSTVGGARTVEPAIDLAMAISIVSSLKGTPPRPDLVAVGEISLTGEVRACTGTQRRLAEAARLGFASAIVPAQGSEDLAGVEGITVFTVSDLATAIRVAFPTDSQ
ncbi:putative DNA repair protein RadA, partial [Actinomyces sp. ICM58]|uniref:DNA repair protein RadA n=2 Tax=Actinomyces TaxID=1654 RepID=UPI000277138F